ncbi:energy-coupling factor transporter transmembrane component T family protein [Thauera sp. SDU_THAU2]|uniref:energy-coupling factor transporter transmembrane component T family protein n=1 Tax=Thauera sp. SDU_THAU2 TaxID=3136633 RepID=UPI003120366A
MNGLPMAAAPRWPRLRLAAAIGASLVVSLLSSHAWLMAAVAFGAMVMAAALWRSSGRGRLLRRLLAVNGFVAMLWLSLPWQFGAEGVTASAAGQELALQISLRTNAIALCCLGLLDGLDAFAIGRAAAGLGLPARMARLLTLMVRYFGLLADSRRRIERAMRARGFRPGMNRRTLQVCAQLVALLLVQAMLRAERVEVAMRARGFRT